MKISAILGKLMALVVFVGPVPAQQHKLTATKWIFSSSKSI